MFMSNFDLKNLPWTVLKKLANLNLSIFILFLISICCVVGSLIEQDQNLLYYQDNYPITSLSISILNWKLIYYLGLDHIFQTAWFILILIVFMLTLLSCTFFTQLPSLRNARRWKFIYQNDIHRSDFSFTNNDLCNNNSLIIMTYSLLYTDFFVFGQGDSIYSYKGLYGRISPIFVHFSLVAILLGSMFSFLSNFVAQEIIPNGELFHIRNIVHSGLFNCFPPNLFGHIDNFSIDYNVDGSIRQFFSKLSLISGQNEVVLTKTISVNKPLKYRHLTFYQTDWELNAFKIRLADNQMLQKKLVKTVINNKKCWLCNIIMDDYKQVFFAIFDLSSPIVLFNSEGLLIGKILIGQPFYLNNLFFVIDDVLTSTGLQIKMDSGIVTVYLGFFALMLSTVLSYLSYSQVWFYKYFDLFQFLASTNRAALSFEENLVYINSLYCYLVVYSSSNNDPVICFILK